jgi:UDP-2,3-diacylglucosamine pyrophosphatase LpxH
MGSLRCDTLIISDLHLGSEVSQAKAALRMLKSIEFERLILLGDIFCDLDFSRLNKDHWHFLGYIRKLSNPKRGKIVVWVEGNHDKGLSKLMSHLVGVSVYQQYQWTIDGKRHIAVHGHQFDRFSVENGILCSFGVSIYMLLQKVDSKSQRFTRMLDRLNTRWLGLAAKVRRGAFHLASVKAAQRVFCGHTHVAASEYSNGIHYVNAGSWTTLCPSYVMVNADAATLCYWDNADSGASYEVKATSHNQEAIASFTARAFAAE